MTDVLILSPPMTSVIFIESVEVGPSVITTTEAHTLVVNESDMSLITASEQGPAGPQGIQGELGTFPYVPDLALIFEGALI